MFKVAELRVAGDGARTMSGHAAVFNLDSEEMFGFTERVAAGAFTRTLQEDDIRALFNHDPNFVLGRNTASTLRLSEDDTGLQFESSRPIRSGRAISPCRSAAATSASARSAS
jgi:HK97 family phage prohead protease